jgi:hypothetical protein
MPDFNTNLGALGQMQANQSQSMSKMSWGPYAEAYEQKFGYNPNLIKATGGGVLPVQASKSRWSSTRLGIRLTRMWPLRFRRA